ncbi:MAG: hypothetical protein ABIB47_05405 [Candidatus Woesearchaeota archaeon]
MGLRKKRGEKKGVIFLSLVFLVYSLFFLIISIQNSYYEYVYYNVAMMVGFVVFLFFNEKIHLKLPMIFGLLVLGFLHLAGGNILLNGLRLYENSLFLIPYDKIVHVFGTFVVTLIIYNIIHSTLKEKYESKLFFVGSLVFIVGLGLGTLVEILEFFATLIFESTIVGDYSNNAGDLVANAFGALIGTIFSLMHFKKK